MRRSFKGAAAVAALCAGALTMTSVAVASLTTVPGSGSDAKDVRVSGDDRIQTSIEALAEHKGNLNIMIVGYQGIVDALSLPPLVEKYGDSAILYADRNGLDQRVLDAMKRRASNIQHVFISGGYGAVPEAVYNQLFATDKLGDPVVFDDTDANRAKVVRIAGADRFETAYLTAALAKATDGKLFKALRDLNALQRTKAELPQIQAKYAKAKADLAAAKAAKTAADAKVAATYKVYEEQLEKTKNHDVDAAKKAYEHAQHTVTPLENSFFAAAENNKLGATLQKFAELFRNDTWKDTTLTDLRKYAAKQGNQDLVNAVNSASKALPSAKTVGEVVSRFAAAYSAAQQAYNNAFSNFNDASNKLIEATANEKARQTAGSPYVVAANAWESALKEQTKALAALGTAQQNFAQALADYESAMFALFDGVLESDLKGAVDTAAAASFAPGDFHIYLATGMNFADALTAGPAAKADDGVVLLSNDSTLPSYVAAAIQQSSKDVYGIGGPAANAYDKSIKVVGSDRYETAVKVSERFFNADPGTYALASGETGADAVVAGVFMASLNNGQAKGVLLTAKSYIPASLSHFVQYAKRVGYQRPVKDFVVFGGEGVIDRAVVAELKALSHN